MALGENADVEAALDDLDRLADFPAAGLAVDYDVTACVASHSRSIGIFSSSFLATKRGSPGMNAERGEDVEEALMVSDQDVGLQAGKILEAFDLVP